VRQQTNLDIVIFGAGIAGLWTLARLRQAGYRVALFERKAIGGVQSIASQGIIHGGTKYALTGKLTGSAMAIGEMPGIWRAALAGEGEIDLRDVRVLSPHQFLWTTGSLASGMAGFFAGKVMQSRMQPLDRAGFPPPFDDPGFRGQVYRLDEPVLDPLSLAQVLAKQLGDACYRLPDMPAIRRQGDHWSIQFDDNRQVSARLLVFAAGKGNAELLDAVGRASPRMQLRPLRMLMLRGRLPALYAHCLGASANPRLTVTSSGGDDADRVWYLGGQVAEEGVMRGEAEQVQAGRDELASLLPWVRFGELQWATLAIDRAEPAMPGGHRPDDAFVDAGDGVITCWPTKLAFAPRVARLVVDAVEQAGLRPGAGEPMKGGEGLDLPMPPVAQLPWDEVTTWS
jgi:glycine/D-amino acid oxidase-like deaminating enzyme